MRLFCFGLGYTGRALSDALAAEGWQVTGTTRKGGPASLAFARDGPLTDPRAALGGASHILSGVPPDAAGCPVLDAHGPDLARQGGVAWIGYLSTTGVYGDRGGDWVDEATEPRPSGERQRQRRAAEAGWLGLWRQYGLPVHVFRLAGIYGPGRSALDAVRAGEARRIVKPGQVFSRIHVADIVAVLMASMARPDPGAIYNVADDEPAAAQTVVEHACRLLGVEPPPVEALETAALSPMARSFYADNRRVRNDRIKRELGVHLAYPTYREGLAAILTGAPMGTAQ
ncbi:MAG: SDR family oxidoreductase [Alphaproteobacteria bacterium]|nr:SDR family oxidoreductase [Alphaproteobacteria bacterium]